jgi:hypothetical protein
MGRLGTSYTLLLFRRAADEAEGIGMEMGGSVYRSCFCVSLYCIFWSHFDRVFLFLISSMQAQWTVIYLSALGAVWAYRSMGMRGNLSNLQAP